MVQKIQLVVFLALMLILRVASDTNNQDFIGLKSLKDIWQNTPPTWEGSDPCGEIWEGIRCDNSRVTSIILPSMGLIGKLSGDIGQFSELHSLDLSYNKNLSGPLPPAIGNLKKLYNLLLVGCSFYGPIPDTIGNLQQLNSLSLNSNKFNGRIPPTIGKLSKLYWLDLADNNLEGPIPISKAKTPGLDLLHQTKHFHLGMNKLSGQIPAQLFSSNMQLIHLLLDSNELTGNIPTTLGLVKSLEVVRMDRNRLTGNVPLNLNNLINVTELLLSENKLTGPVPNLTGMNLLCFVDMSNNSFDPSTVTPWFSTLQSLTTLMMEDTQLQGQIPISLFSLPNLQSLVLKNNMLNGTLDIGTTYSNQLELIDVQHNSITAVSETNYNSNLTLVGNPVGK